MTRYDTEKSLTEWLVCIECEEEHTHGCMRERPDKKGYDFLCRHCWKEWKELRDNRE